MIYDNDNCFTHLLILSSDLLSSIIYDLVVDNDIQSFEILNHIDNPYIIIITRIEENIAYQYLCDKQPSLDWSER